MRALVSLWFVASFLCVEQVSAQQFVAELGPGSLYQPAVADHVVAGNGVVYCQLEVPGYGSELCVTDGTVAGTRVFADLAPGITSSNPRPVAVIGSSVLVIVNGILMITDGTPTGTRTLLSGLGTFPSLRLLGRVGARFVWAHKVMSGDAWSIFSSDGTASGTMQLGTVVSVLGSAERTGLLTIGADSGTNALQLFASDGLSLSPIATLPVAGRSGFARLGSYDYFVVEDASPQATLWRTDGTTIGTTFVCTLGAPQGTCSVAAFGAGLWIGASNQLWSSDGTAAGTYALPIALRAVDGLTPLGSRLVFKNGRFGVGGLREELWSTDGTVAGTGPIHTAFNYYGTFEVAVSRAFCPADATARNLLRTDGTAAGTVSIPIDSLSVGTSIATIGNDAITAMRRPFSVGPAQVCLFKTDGTNAGTVLLSSTAFPSGVRTFAPGEAFGTTLCFAMSAGSGSTMYLWRTDGTSQGTRTATGVPFAANGYQRFRGALWFTAGNGGFFRYEPESDSIAFVPSPFSGQSSKLPLGVVDDALIVQVLGGTNSGLWRSDGTAAGSSRIATLGMLDAVPAFARLGSNFFWVVRRTGFVHLFRDDPALGTSVDLGESTNWLGRVGDRLVFTRPAAAPGTGFDLLSVSSTNLVPQFVANVPLAPAFSRAVGSRLVCMPSGGVPFVTDGISSATPLPMPPVRAPWFEVDGFVYASSVSTGASESLWRTDGTAVGTTVAASFAPGGLTGFVEAAPIGVGNRILLDANDGSSGSEPWISAGTPATTQLLADLVPNGSSSPRLLGVAGERAYFIAFDPVRGRELWSLDLASIGAASVQPYGVGCAGSNGIPRLAVDGIPSIGRTLSLRIERGAPSSLGLWFVGLGPQRLPVGGGCEFLMTTVAWSDWTFTDAAGAASTSLSVPNDPVFVGLTIVAQGSCLDPLGVSSFGTTVTEGVLLVLGG